MCNFEAWSIDTNLAFIPLQTKSSFPFFIGEFCNPIVIWSRQFFLSKKDSLVDLERMKNKTRQH